MTQAFTMGSLNVSSIMDPELRFALGNLLEAIKMGELKKVCTKNGSVIDGRFYVCEIPEHFVKHVENLIHKPTECIGKIEGVKPSIRSHWADGG